MFSKKKILNCNYELSEDTNVSGRRLNEYANSLVKKFEKLIILIKKILMKI